MRVRKRKNITSKEVALVMNGYINGLGLIRSLGKDRSIPIILLAEKGSIASVSKYLSESYEYDHESEVDDFLLDLNERFECIIPFPAGDTMLRHLVAIKGHLSNFSIPWDDMQLSEKPFQMELAKKTNIKVPSSFTLSRVCEIQRAKEVEFPVIVKPLHSKKDIVPFKAMIVQTFFELKDLVSKPLNKGVSFIVSAYLPGDDANLFTYAGYSTNGRVVAEYTGRKLTQVPHLRGVAGIAESITDNKISQIGREFMSSTGFTGIFQIEFKKYNDEYYFIELNCRNWLWSYLATHDGVNLPLIRFYFEARLQLPEVSQKRKGSIFFWFDSVLYNIFRDKWAGVFLTLLRIVFRKKTYAVFNIRDIGVIPRNVKKSLLYIIGIKRGVL